MSDSVSSPEAMASLETLKKQEPAAEPVPAPVQVTEPVPVPVINQNQPSASEAQKASSFVSSSSNTTSEATKNTEQDTTGEGDNVTQEQVPTQEQKDDLLSDISSLARQAENKVEEIISSSSELKTIVTDGEAAVAAAVQQDVLVPLEKNPVGFVGSELSLPAVETLVFKIFIDAVGNYYAAVAARNPGDSQIPHPSPNLYDTLVSEAKKNPGQSVEKSVLQSALSEVGNGSGTEYTNSGHPLAH